MKYLIPVAFLILVVGCGLPSQSSAPSMVPSPSNPVVSVVPNPTPSSPTAVTELFRINCAFTNKISGYSFIYEYQSFSDGNVTFSCSQTGLGAGSVTPPGAIDTFSKAQQAASLTPLGCTLPIPEEPPMFVYSGQSKPNYNQLCVEQGNQNTGCLPSDDITYNCTYEAN